MLRLSPKSINCFVIRDLQSLWTLTNPDVCETLEGATSLRARLRCVPLWLNALAAACVLMLLHTCLMCCLAELDDRITSVFALFESEVLHVHSAM